MWAVSVEKPFVDNATKQKPPNTSPYIVTSIRFHKIILGWIWGRHHRGDIASRSLVVDGHFGLCLRWCRPWTKRQSAVLDYFATICFCKDSSEAHDGGISTGWCIIRCLFFRAWGEGCCDGSPRKNLHVVSRTTSEQHTMLFAFYSLFGFLKHDNVSRHCTTASTWKFENPA